MTDNKAFLNHDKITGNRIDRWKWVLQEFDFTIEHISTNKNLIADAFSRCIFIKSETRNSEETLSEFIKNLKDPTEFSFHIHTL